MIQVSTKIQEPRADWLKEPPPEWERRLREISPITDRVSHLRFRWRDEDEQWALYQCTPAALLSADRVTQLSVHWSDLPKDQQQGRKQLVTEYQFYMFRTHRVEASLFWILQGTQFIQGGTPYEYTERERKLLDAANEPSEPIPPGLLPNVPFDERVVQAIQARDRLLKFGGNLDAMQKASTASALKKEDEETEQEFRKRFLDWHHQNNAPAAEFMKWFGRREEAQYALPPAPDNLANAITDFRDRYIETGVVAGAGHAASRILVPVG